jgi:tetratricopeptide (TPR) repeat protein
MTTRPRLGEAAALGALLLFVAGRCLVPMDETDLFYNLRLGEIVLARHGVPRTNLLSFTFPDARDVNLAWIFQIVLALAYRAGGVAGTVLLKTAFVVATFALLFAAARRRGAHPAAAAAALALAAWAAEPRFVERPHLCTFLGLAFLLLGLARAEGGRPRTLWALVLLAPIWANANSCFFLAPAVLGLYAGGALADGRRADARRAALLAAVLVPFIFATPSGGHALGYIANHWRMPSLRPLQEYRAASWPVDGPFFFVAAGVLAALALPGRQLRYLVPALALGLLGARRVRFVAEFALLAGPIVAGLLSALGGRVARRFPTAPRLATVAVTAALAGFTIVPRAAAARRGERLVDIGLEPGLVPEAAIRFVDESGLRDRLYNDLEVGSYLAWQGWPKARVFQDPRINGYPSELHAILRRDDLRRADWQALLDRFEVTSALVSYPDVNPRAALFDPAGWALVYRDGEALVFARRVPGLAALIARRELPVTFSYARPLGVEDHALDAPPAASPVAACEWQRRLGDRAVEIGDDRGALDRYQAARAVAGCLTASARGEAGLALGDAALRLSDPATAAAAYAGIDTPRAHRNRGLALLALGRNEEALAELGLALRAVPDDADARRAEAIARGRLQRRLPAPAR